MSHAITAAPSATIADYEAFVEGRPDHERWELIDGVIEMMTNPTENHGQISMNLALAVKAAMDRRGCRTYAGSMRVQRSDDRKDSDAAVPDIVVRCGPSGNRTFVTDPIVIVEVLSRSTMDRDRGPKLSFYKTLPMLQHIVIIYQDQMRVEHYRRIPDGWTSVTLRRPSDRLDLDAVDFSIDLDTIYFDVPVLRPAAPPEGYEDDVPILIP